MSDQSGHPLAKPPRLPDAIAGNPGTTSKSWPVWLVCLVMVPPTVVAVEIGTRLLGHYGYAVFVIIPLIVGWMTARVYNDGRVWHWPRTMGVVGLVLGLTALGLMIHLSEGLICLAMAAVVAAPFVVVGMLIASAMRPKLWVPKSRPPSSKVPSLVVVLLVPASMTMESLTPPPPPVLEVTTRMEINAPPETVWQFIPAFPPIEKPPAGMLALGLAFPLASTMQGAGVGARRECVLSTGTMPEEVTVWQPARCLEFKVLSTPAAMQETNPFGQVEAPHAEGYFQCLKGRFVLTPLPGGRTGVEGTSWFQHDLWPQFYWAPITREVVREVQTRVLTHIKALAERSPP